ncbi:hypothetical protein Lesp02_82000 [Lentzea sp. NBRC 105346]|uniref:cysteine/serine endopeptidase inhibitor n=1 Tax=Lentzea sp. NBRC 105346 TaxID=3032205 RepID=UPI0024A48FAD|nr:cysteine/serine endopeptidase inhibitor [Lentzea sp. NBRC 105346]GLZ36013.1 hypothetical protein Lesp02_82000 [Lentzea sp. NBRC 105346]
MRQGAVLTALLALLFVGSGSASAIGGKMTWYNDKGYGACGTRIDASSQNLAAVPKAWFTSSNPNNDPVCRKSVRVTYKGKSVTVPVRDMCPSCDRSHVDLSVPAFRSLANLDLGVVGVTWEFVG